MTRRRSEYSHKSMRKDASKKMSQIGDRIKLSRRGGRIAVQRNLPARTRASWGRLQEKKRKGLSARPQPVGQVRQEPPRQEADRQEPAPPRA